MQNCMIYLCHDMVIKLLIPLKFWHKGCGGWSIFFGYQDFFNAASIGCDPDLGELHMFIHHFQPAQSGSQIKKLGYGNETSEVFICPYPSLFWFVDCPGQNLNILCEILCASSFILVIAAFIIRKITRFDNILGGKYLIVCEQLSKLKSDLQFMISCIYIGTHIL